MHVHPDFATRRICSPDFAADPDRRKKTGDKPRIKNFSRRDLRLTAARGTLATGAKMPATNPSTMLRNIRTKPSGKWSPAEFAMAAGQLARECGWHEHIVAYNRAQMALPVGDRLSRKHIMRDVWKLINPHGEDPPLNRLEQRAFRIALIANHWTCNEAGFWAPPWYRATR